MRYRIIIFLLVICKFLLTEGKTVNGHVVDSLQTDLPYANVLLFSDSTFLTGTVTNEYGRFLFERDFPNANNVRISIVGFDEYDSSIPDDGNLGTIIMHPASMMLEEIIVRSNHPITRISNGIMVTKVANSILADAGTANDVLSKLPMVTGVDGDFSVFGRGKPVIFINGRIIDNPSELYQLNSHDIKEVEVITNPGAEFPANTNAVIRIKTAPPKSEGFSVTLYSYNRFANYAVSTDNVDLKYRQGGFEIFASGYFYGGKRKFQDLSSLTTYGSRTMTQDINAPTVTTSTDIYPKIGFNYQFGTDHSFGAYYEYGHEKLKNDGDIISNVAIDGSPSVSLMQHQHGSSLTSPIHDANLYYNGKISGLSIDFNASFLKKDKHQNNIQKVAGAADDIDDITSNSNSSNRMWAEKLLLSYPVWKGSLQIGEEFTDSRSSYFSKYTGADIYGGDILIRENNLACMAEIRQTFGVLQATLGVRFEHVNYRYFDGPTQNMELSRTYSDWFPSLSLNSIVGNVNISLSVTSRTNRPAYNQLDGTILYVNRYIYQNGNPSLSPARVYSAQLMAQWRFLFAQTLYSYERNSIFTTVRSYDGSQDVKLATFENVPRYQNFQLAFGTRPSLRCWSPQVTAGVFCNFYSEIVHSKEKSFRRPYFFINWDNAVSLPHNWVFDIDLMARTAGYTSNYYLKASGYVNIGIRKSFLNNTLTLQLKANDIFNTNNLRNILYSGDIKIEGEHRQESHNIVFSVNYRFNASNSKYKGTGAGTNEKERF